MGTTSSVNAEWIELYNNSDTAVSLDGWTLVASDGSPDISISGNISAWGYFLLERTSDTSVPGISADIIYTGALANTGETLYLKNSSGSTVDTVVGGSDWSSVGGDKDTKETAQYASSGWFTGEGTPKAKNIGVVEVVYSGEDTVDEIEAHVSETKNSVRDNSTEADIYTERNVAVVGVPFEFVGSGDRETETSGIGYRWNFGDGTTGSGNIIRHTFLQTGEYEVYLSSTKRGSNKKVDSVIVEVIEPQVSITWTETGVRGYVSIRNSSEVSVDMSGWILTTSQGERFCFPAMSSIAGGSTIRIMNSVSGFSDPYIVFINNSHGDIVSSYPKKIEAPAPVSGGFVKGVSVERDDVLIEEGTVSDDESIRLTKNDPLDIKKKDSLFLYVGALLLVILVAIGMVFIYPVKNRDAQDDALTVDDIEILE